MRRAALVLAAALALLLAGGQTVASSDGQIVILGAHSGSHLYLNVDGNSLKVHGYMDSSTPTGCHFTEFRTDASCPLNGISSIAVNMGPSGDKVEVLDPLPVPLIAYLGKGSDKLIANNEPDTCYPQGTRRNRCIGGGGNDICITGPRNSDCVGGPGRDYCQHSTGSDGCWGGPGDDVCKMGPGKDGCHGEGGNDRLYEGSGGGKLYGGPGNDFLQEGGGNGKDFGGPGADTLYGGGGSDKLYGGGGRDFCDGQGARGKSFDCETGPRH